MTTAAAWRWCLAAGLLAFACSVGFGRIPGLHPCGGTDELGAILSFEFARSPADVAALFGSEPCRSTLVAGQWTGLWLDGLGFIPAYTAFLCFAAWATGASLRRWIIAALLIAGLCDEVEGLLLATILRELPGGSPTLAMLFWVVRTKFLMLAVGTLAIGGVLLARPTVLRVVAGLLIGLGAGAALSGLFAMPDMQFPGMMAGFTIAWATLLLVAALGAVWPRLLATRPPAPAGPNV